jgi:hypothetical protein
MYKCLVCEKPVTVSSVNSLDSNPQLKLRSDYEFEDQRSALLHSPIKKINPLAPAPASPSSELPLPPVIAPAAVSTILLISFS